MTNEPNFGNCAKALPRRQATPHPTGTQNHPGPMAIDLLLIQTPIKQSIWLQTKSLISCKFKGLYI